MIFTPKEYAAGHGDLTLEGNRLTENKMRKLG